MQELFSRYPQYVALFSAAAAILLIAAIVSALSASTGNTGEIALPKNDYLRKLTAEECRLDQHARASYCKTQGRTVRVIAF